LASVLPELTDQDLKDLGVALGHRRKMLRAIRDLGSVSVSRAVRKASTIVPTSLSSAVSYLKSGPTTAQVETANVVPLKRPRLDIN
jgi:hypothetical protein